MNKSIILACGHYASYEWMNALQLYGLDYGGFGSIKRSKISTLINWSKTYEGGMTAHLISTTKATKTITENQENGVLGVYAMVADQSPKLAAQKCGQNFMGIQTPVFTGTEKLSQHLDMAVVYLHVEKVKRGYYSATFKTSLY